MCSASSRKTDLETVDGKPKKKKKIYDKKTRDFKEKRGKEKPMERKII